MSGKLWQLKSTCLRGAKFEKDGKNTFYSTESTLYCSRYSVSRSAEVVTQFGNSLPCLIQSYKGDIIMKFMDGAVVEWSLLYCLNP